MPADADRLEERSLDVSSVLDLGLAAPQWGMETEQARARCGLAARPATVVAHRADRLAVRIQEASEAPDHQALGGIIGTMVRMSTKLFDAMIPMC